MSGTTSCQKKEDIIMVMRTRRDRSRSKLSYVACVIQLGVALASGWILGGLTEFPFDGDAITWQSIGTVLSFVGLYWGLLGACIGLSIQAGLVGYFLTIDFTGYWNLILSMLSLIAFLAYLALAISPGIFERVYYEEKMSVQQFLKENARQKVAVRMFRRYLFNQMMDGIEDAHAQDFDAADFNGGDFNVDLGGGVDPDFTIDIPTPDFAVDFNYDMD